MIAKAMPASNNPNKEITIRDLYPQLDEEQLKEAEENLDRYIELALRMYERIRLDPEAYRQFKALTAQRDAAMMRNTRSKPP
ncbi:hypothetical protein MYX75_10835 [Acidobacteria bacterium AH-259-A15]|nr:hypothetical protein [Acidobacteria bacterium AH-259-A15]